MVAAVTTSLIGTLAMLFGRSQAIGGTSKKVLLKNVKSLTLRKDKMTSHRRVSAVPQLKCIGGEGCSMYQVDVMRCENAGADYDEDSIQWTCKASVPEDFKLGSTDVMCEGYSNSKDPFILKGSCGVEYRLLLSDKGIEKYGSKSSYSYGGGEERTSKLFAWAFWLAFFAVVFIMARSAFRNLRDSRGGAPGNNNHPRPPPYDGGGGGGDDGGWFGNDGSDPPPPYSKPSAPSTASSRQSTAGGWAQTAANQARNYQPGFWTGAVGGAAATYLGNRMAGPSTRRGYDQTHSPPSRPATRQRPSGNGEGSSSSSYSSTFHSTTGFGGTNNR